MGKEYQTATPSGLSILNQTYSAENGAEYIVDVDMPHHVAGQVDIYPANPPKSLGQVVTTSVVTDNDFTLGLPLASYDVEETRDDDGTLLHLRIIPQ